MTGAPFFDHERQQWITPPEDPPLRLVMTPAGVLVDAFEQETEAQRAQEQERSLASQSAQRQANAQGDADALAAAQRAAEDQLRAELPKGVPS